MAEPVDIILLSYNRLDYLVEMVNALEQRTRWPYRLTIVDNASGSTTRQWLRDEAARFHQILWNEHNEHLAALQRGIAATQSKLFVVSDADLIVSEPTAEGCWLTRLFALAERHPDFGLVGVRLDTVTAARNAQLERAPLVDGELLETATGVWLNLIRRAALRIPYMSDGITCHALRRAGYRVGIAADVYASHLGDADGEQHPDYLARKQAASGWKTTYPRYRELDALAPPPTLRALALAAPVLAALEQAGVDASETIELFARHPVLSVVEPRIGPVRADQPAEGARAVAIVEPDGEHVDLARAFEVAGEYLLLLSRAAVPDVPSSWVLAGEYPGVSPVLMGLACVASRPRWRRRLLYSTVEHRDRWLAVFRAGCFGDDGALRVYAFSRSAPSGRSAATAPTKPQLAATARPFAQPVRVRERRVGALATKLRRLLRAEWLLFRARGR